MVARINLHHVYQIISNQDGLGKSGESLLAYRNKNGDAVFFTHRKFITEAEARDIIPKKDVNVPITQALLGKQKEFLNYVDYRNVPVFSVTKYIDEIDAGLVVKIDQEEVLEAVIGNIKQIWYSTAVIIFAIIIIGVIFYFLLTYSLRKEVKSKTSALEKAAIGLKKNITQLQTSERELDKTIEKLNIATHSAQIAIWEWDIKNNHTFWSGKSEEALGFPSQAFGNNLETYMEYVHPEDIDAINERVSHSLEQKLIVYQSEYRVIRPDGEIRWISSPGQVFYDPSGEPNRIAGIMIDITDRKKAEEERIVLETRLQQSQKMESIGTLAGGIAHDFNNILYPIIGFTELSMQELSKTHEVQENLQDILEGAKRARDLVKQILMFARQEKQTLKPTVLKPVVEEAMKLLRSSIPANIDIQGNLYDGNDFVLCDATEIHEIVMNLCTNAYHSMEESGGAIVVRLDKQNPLPDLNLPPGEYLCLSVSDNGVGIPIEIIDKIFEPYLTTKEIGKGSGLGLSVVHGIVTNYDGDISVESSPGNGSVFNVFLPVTTQSKKVEQKLIKDKPLDGTENILFVDDEASIVKLAKRILERLGYTITGKTSCTEALELFKEKPDEFDLVITDMAMPIMTGTEFAKKILKIQPDIPIIMCSGFSEKVDSDIAKSIGIKEYIKKPILTDELTSKIREVLDQSSKG